MHVPLRTRPAFWAAMLGALVLLIGTLPVTAGPRGSFGGGGRSFGGSFGGSRSSFGGSRSSFGGSFGGSRSPSSSSRSSFGGSFGGTRSRSSSSGSSFGGSTGSSRSRSSSSFGSSTTSPGYTSRGTFSRSGSFGTSGIGRSTSVRPGWASQSPVSRGTYYYGGRSVPAYGYGGWSGYSFYWGAPMWYYWTPFHPAFYMSPPVYYGGVMYPGGFSLTRLIIGIVVIGFVVWLVGRLFFRRKGLRYTSY